MQGQTAPRPESIFLQEGRDPDVSGIRKTGENGGKERGYPAEPDHADLVQHGDPDQRTGFCNRPGGKDGIYIRH